MKHAALLLALVLSGPLLATSSRAASVDVSVSFYDSLAPYGDWIENERFGTVWTPRNVESTWRPYTRGQWVYSDYGWTWASDEDWGWATDHYGRWYLDRSEGWIWVPGDEWAPAWVNWRSGEGYVGWAPLPPGIDAFGEVDYDADPFAFCFVEERYFLAPGVFHHFVPLGRNVTYLRLTRNVTHYRRMNDRIVNFGIDIHHIERISGHAVPHAQIRDVWSAADARRARVRHGEVALFHPSVVSSRPTAEPGVAGAWHARSDANRPEIVIRRQEHERQQAESALARQRRELEKMQKREIKHPPQVFAERAPEHEQPRRNAIQQSTWINREQLNERHEAERKAQAAVEQRQREILQQRHEREQRAVHAQPEKAKSDDSHHKHERH